MTFLQDASFLTIRMALHFIWRLFLLNSALKIVTTAPSTIKSSSFTSGKIPGDVAAFVYSFEDRIYEQQILNLQGLYLRVAPTSVNADATSRSSASSSTYVVPAELVVRASKVHAYFRKQRKDLHSIRVKNSNTCPSSFTCFCSPLLHFGEASNAADASAAASAASSNSVVSDNADRRPHCDSLLLLQPNMTVVIPAHSLTQKAFGSEKK